MKAPGHGPRLTRAAVAAGAEPRSLANFDSSTAFLRSIGASLRGSDTPGTGVLPPVEPLARAINALPRRVREELYRFGGWKEAVPLRSLPGLRAENISRWMVRQYPRERSPAVMIGSSNGAGAHLAAAMGMPWLPQTYLVPVLQYTVHPDEPQEAYAKFQEAGRRLLDANPELQLHHMHDANQDRLMVNYMTYFRLKRRRLGEAFERFLEQRLARGGTIYLVECELSWPTTRVDDRYVFQHGALGGATAEEFNEGGERVEEYLRRYGSPRRRWEPPEPDGVSPEAEWGFAPELREDVERIARRRGYRIRRVVFEQPEDLSPLVADLHRWWYRRRQMPASRLVVGSFMLVEPHLTLRTGSVPFWMVFNKEPSADVLEQYLDWADPPFDEIAMTLFSHGVESVGLVPIERWREILSRARRRGTFLGVDERTYPRDFGVFVRFNKAMRRLPARYPVQTLHQRQLDEFLEAAGDRYAVRWVDHAPRSSRRGGPMPAEGEVGGGEAAPHRGTP